MMERKSGVVLNASSIVGSFGQTNYAASKFCVIGMAKTWAREPGRHGIRVNAVCPGFIETSILKAMPEKLIRSLEERVPLGRLGKPEEFSSTFAFPASDEAGFISGAVIEVSGGMAL
jgi:3-oxoacyl-[acyl-carrier protein] reductase